MKKKPSRRVLSLVIALCMVAALLPASALASDELTASEDTDSGLTVEYFSSTLYNWDQTTANDVTMAADVESTTTSWASTSVSYSQNSNYSNYTSGSYYVLVGTEYYVVTDISCTRSNSSGGGSWPPGGGSSQNYTYSWTVTYDGGTAAGTNSTFTLYYQSTSTSYAGNGFYFTNSDTMNSTLYNGGYTSIVPLYSKWAGSNQNYYIYSGLAASKLSDSENAPFSNDITAANLFATDGSNEGEDGGEDYADVYENVNVPFYIDDDGYYNLDSDTNAVYFEDGTGKDGATMLIADLPASYSWSNYYVTGFAPFNTVTSNTVSNAVKGGYSLDSSNANTSAYTINGSMTYGFGMVTSVDFQMTDDGKDANGNDITFEFAGDDDVWVYIDGVLVLDIGGTHDAIDGTINFVTGDVTLTSSYSAGIGDLAVTKNYNTTTASYSLSQTNLYTALDTTLTGFASEGTHTMTIYYMDRGEGRTNCKIRFNLPQKDSVSVTKTIDEYYTSSEYEISDDVMNTLNNMDFTFTLYNSDGVVANKSYSLYDSSGNFVSTGSTDSAGTFTLKNGYTATFKNISLDEESSYYVVETSPGDRWTASWTATSSVSKANISGGSGLTSDTVTVTGSSTATDTISFVCENSYSYGSVQPDVDTHDDTIVLDYGLPVEVDVLANDNVTAYGVAVDSTMTLVDDDDNDNVVYGTYGYATITSDEKIVYTLTEDFCGIETFEYTVSASATNTETGEDETQNDTATLTIIPATSVYYEEDFSYTGESTTFTNSNVNDWNDNSNFISIATNNATFTVQDDNKDYGTYQETGFVGTTDDSTYGTDAVYLDNLGDSYGTSLKVDTSEGAAQYKYTFTGEGTTIYGRVSDSTAYVKVTINAIDENGEEIKSTSVEPQVIDTINLVTTVDEDGDDTILDDTLYNIPIYQNNGLDYGTYVVRVYVYTKGTSTGSRDSSGGEFYLDGVRVYKPMGDSTEDNDGYDTAASAYATDGEANVSVVNIRKKMVSDDGDDLISDIFTLTDINGTIEDVDTYNNIGPNEEFYLKDGYSLEFALVGWDSQSYKIYLGMKAPNGTASEVSIGSGTFNIENSADCYYDISDYVEVETDDDGTIGYVTIEGIDGLTALTNIKVTGTDPFELVTNTDSESENGGNDEGTNTILLTSTAYAASLSEAEEEEIAAFEPSSISVSCTYASKTKKATVNVVTSKDVSYVTIDGEMVSAKTVSGKYRFSMSYTKVASGTTYEIIAYDADGVASQVYTVTAE